MQELTIEEAAREIGLSESKGLQAQVRADSSFQEIGLYPLSKGNTIKRQLWEDRTFVVSPFQEAARKLELGTPVLFK